MPANVVALLKDTASASPHPQLVVCILSLKKAFACNKNIVIIYVLLWSFFDISEV
jgi:hypothetical protein